MKALEFLQEEPKIREKGLGYFGELKRPDGKISTELSIGVNMDGRETEIPSLVPTLTKTERDYLLGGNKPTEQIISKSIQHAKRRIAEGKNPFAQKGEQLEIEKPSAMQFLDQEQRKPHGVTGTFEPSLLEKGLEFVTGGHIVFDPRKLAPPPEVDYDPVTGKEVIHEPETAGMGFFEDPMIAIAMGTVQGARYGGKLTGKLLRAGRETAAWGTGGVTEIPAITKGGAKLAGRAISAKPMEKTMAKAALKQPLGREAVTGEEALLGKLAGPGRLAPESEFAKKEFCERFLEGKAEPEILIKERGRITPRIAPEKVVTLYGGLPIHKAGQAYTKHIGEPIWDKLVMKKIPKLLEKVPGGKALNRAFIYDYRGNLPNTPGYLRGMEDMRRYQEIGREYAVDLGKRLQEVPEQAQLRMGEYIRGEIQDLSKGELGLANEAKRALYDLGKQAVDLGMLSEKTFFKNAGRYMPRLYTSKEYQSLLTRYNLTKPNRLDLSRFKKRKDIPKEIREKMGEILTPGYPVAKGIMQLTHDIEMARFFNGIATNKEWAIVKQAKISAKTGKPIGYKRTTYDPLTGKPIEHYGIKKEFTEPIPEGWKQLPSNKKLGSLSESYVHPEIHADLQQMIHVMETPEKVWRKALGAWKFGKVIVSPKTHVRNLMSNSILAHLGGLPMYEQPIYLTKGAKAMINKGELWKAAKEEGLLRHTFTNAELMSLFNQVEGKIGGIKAASIPEALGVIGQGWVKTKAGLGKAAKLYEAEEQWFKMAKFIHNIERKGMKIPEAAKDAEKWLFNYAKVTKFQEKYRTKWYGAPFCTFTFKALPRIAEAMVKTPWRFALPMSMIYGLERAAQRKIGDTAEEIKAKKELRPEWQKGKMLGMPNFARVPIVDEYGREYYLNLTYILPWGDIAEAGKFGPIPGGVMPFSQPFVKEPVSQIMNWDPFWKQEIVKEKEIAGKTKLGKIKTEAKLRAQHVGQAMLPTPVMDVAKGVSALRGKPDIKGRLRPPGIVAADVFAGVKMYAVDYVEQTAREIAKLDPQKGYIARKIKSDIKTLSIKKAAVKKAGGNIALYDKQIEDKIAQLKGLAKEARQVGKTYKKIKKKE